MTAAGLRLVTENFHLLLKKKINKQDFAEKDAQKLNY